MAMQNPSERDDKLIRYGFTPSSRLVCREFREWIQQEVKACKNEVMWLEPACEGKEKEELTHIKERLDDIDRVELLAADNNLDEKLTEIEDGAWDDILDAWQWIEDAISRFERLAREMLTIRNNIASPPDD